MPTKDLFKVIGEFCRRNKIIKCHALILSRLIEFPIVLSLLSPQKGEKICDVACGSGELSFRVAKRGPEVYGVDISISQIKKCKIFSNDKKYKCEFVVGDAEHLPYRSEVFDKAVSICSLEHFQDGLKALKEMHRILKPGGILVLTVDSFSYPKINKKIINIHRKRSSVVKYYNYESIKLDLEKVGFEVFFGKYLINSSVSSFFFDKMLVEFKVPIPLLVIISYIVFPICVICDKLFGVKNGGYELVIKARKRSVKYLE